MRYYDTDSFVETPRDPRGLRCASLRNEPNGWHPTVSVVGPSGPKPLFSAWDDRPVQSDVA